MGQSGSTHHGQITRGRSFKQMSLSGLRRKNYRNGKNLSHAFTYVDGGLKADQLNLNTATEEELMTLPGINRTIARNIVNHRQAIGQFHRVEDLALVSGVGAHRLELVRPEVCVLFGNTSWNSSQGSICSESLRVPGNLLDINSASVFALQGIPGLNQELAANLVERRLRRGPYRSINELVKVQGIGEHRLALIKPYLKVVVDSDGSITPTPSNSTSPSLWNNPQVTSTPISNGGAIIAQGESLAANGIASEVKIVENFETSSGMTEEEIWELLSVASPRPLTPSDFSSKLEGRSSLRIATWNLDGFTIDKACNPGVREVICRTILENKLSLLALQEIENTEALAKVTLELNTPTLRRVRDWQENRRVWRSLHLGQGLAILWDSDAKVGITLREQPSATTDLFPLAACATFNINKLTVTIVNAVLRDRDTRERKILENLCTYENVLILGDFSTINGAENLDLELSCKENTAFNQDESFFNDNIAWGCKSKSVLSTGHSGIVKQGLTHLGIPRGWKWGGPASSHCPVWCQIYSQSNNY